MEAALSQLKIFIAQAAVTPTPATETAAPVAVTPPTPADALERLRAALAERTAELTAAKRTVAELQLQQQCSGAVEQQLNREVAQLRAELQRCTAAALQRQSASETEEATTQKLQEKERQLEGLQADMEHLRRLQQECEGAWRATVTAAEALQCSQKSLMLENQKLHATLAELKQQRSALAAAEVERDAAVATVALYDEEVEGWRTEAEQIREAMVSMRLRYEEHVSYVEAAAEDHAALVAALAETQSLNRQWEKLFTEQQGRPRDDSHDRRSPHQDNDAQYSCMNHPEAQNEMSPSSSPSTPEPPVDCRRDAFLHELEVKVVDLAIRLCDAEERADLAEQQASQLLMLHLSDVAAVYELKAIVAATRPSSQLLNGHVLELQAQLAALESFAESLMERCSEMAKLYTEEACHSRILEAQLAATRVGSLVPPLPSDRLSSPDRPGRKTAQQTRRGSDASTAPMIQQSHRHHLSLSALNNRPAR